MRSTLHSLRVSLLAALCAFAASCGDGDGDSAVRPDTLPLTALEQVDENAAPSAIVDMEGADARLACGEVMRAVEEVGLVSERPGQGGYTFNESLMRQLPPDIRQQIVRCVRMAREEQQQRQQRSGGPS